MAEPQLQYTPDGYPYWQAQPDQPAAPSIGAPDPARPLTIMPVDHAPEFETKLKLTPVDHEPDFGMVAKPVDYLPDFADVLDTGMNAPESRQTLEEQQRQLMDGRRPAQMFPAGTEELPLPPGMARTENERDAFHHQPSIQAEEINTLSSQGRENELLNLGPFSKPEIEARAAQGEQPLVITEYTPEGVEVRSAAGTTGTAPIQQSYFEATMTPGNRVVVGPPPARADWARLLQVAGHVIFGGPMPARDGTPQPPSGGMAMGMLDWVKQPGKIVGTEFDTKPAVPGQWSDEDEARKQIHDFLRQEELTSFGAGTAMNMMGVGTAFPAAGLSAGTFGGKLAKGADHAALERAIHLDTTLGAPEKIVEMSQRTGLDIPAVIEAQRTYIWEETGWFKGADGHWRFEISDHDARVQVNAGGDRMPLGDGPVPQIEEFSHPQLYENYPRAAQLPLADDLPKKVPEAPLARAAYVGQDAGISLSPGKLIKEGETRSTLLHENQHHIQEIEGFAEGSSPQIEQSILAGQSLETGSKSAIVEQLRQAILRGEYGMPGEPMFTEAARRLLKLEEEWHADAALENYRKSAGEVEARNVQARRDMTPEERKETPPWYTEDVPQNEQVVRKYERPKPKTDTDTGKPAPPFYSAVAKRIDAIPTAKASPEQWAGVLKNSPGIKAEELKWLGVDDWLKEQKGPVSKKDLQDYVKANQIEIVEKKLLGDELGAHRDSRDIRDYHRISADEWDMMSKAEQDMFRDQMMEKEYGGEPVRYKDYALPGAENYREILLKLPENKGARTGQEVAEAMGRDWSKVAPYERRGFEAQAKRENEKDLFQTQHWPDDPNVIAHLRLSDRIVGNRKTLHAEEIQSDMHQQGRKEGYREEIPQYWIHNRKSGHTSQTFRTKAEAEAYQAALPDMVRGHTSIKHQIRTEGIVPDAPFKTTWPELALKRLIREAAENGYDMVSWTPGGSHPTNPKNLNPEGKIPEEKIKKADAGMKGFYDKIVVDSANKLAKRFGSKVESGTTRTPKPLASMGGTSGELIGRDLGIAEDKIGAWWRDMSHAEREKLREDYLSARVDQQIHTLEITPEMRKAAVGEGFPMFSLQDVPAAKPKRAPQIEGAGPRTKKLKEFIEEPAAEPKGAMPQLAERYPEMAPPSLQTDKKSGKEFLGKELSQEAKTLQKVRKGAQREIDLGNYEPYFDPGKRFDADPAHYPPDINTRDIRPKKEATVEKYRAETEGPEASERLDTAYKKGVGVGEDWYLMGQLEKEFVDELGEKAGREAFKKKFGISMAATTGGADPASNLLMAHYGNYVREKGMPYPEAAHEVPFPVGGRFVTGNLEQHKKMLDAGKIDEANPKRHNFAYNFMGHKGMSTLDEQMSGLFKPGMTQPVPGTYGVHEDALAKRADAFKTDPRRYQEVAWAGTKGLKTQKPMIQFVNELIERTHRVTGMSRKEIVRRGLVRSEIPLYGAAGAVIGGAAAGAYSEGLEPYTQ